MKLMQLLLLAGSLVSVGQANAELYKSVGPDGKVTYSDAPPAHAASVEKKAIGNGGNVSANLPYELARAAGSSPVTLYTAPTCAPCEDGRRLLSQRGIPFQEKTVTTAADIAKLKQVTGAESGLPVLIIGRSTHGGFEAGAWNTALTTAGYPAQSRLPSNYRNPAAEPAAPVAKTASTPQEKSVANREVPPVIPKSSSSAGDAPPGFRF